MLSLPALVIKVIKTMDLVIYVFLKMMIVQQVIKTMAG